jgi:parvulin-like peptidyl-prolyl isomerase
MATQTAVKQKKSAVDTLNQFLSEYSAANKSADSRDIFMAAAAIIALAQRVMPASRMPRDTMCDLLAQVFKDLRQLQWNAVDFPINTTLTSQTYANIFTENNVRDADKHSVLLESLFTFIALLQENPEYAKESILRGIVADSVQTKTTAAMAPELNYRANTLKIFTPGTVAAVDLSPLEIVVYRGELLGGGFGPELWGLAHLVDEKAHVLLETGEYVCVPSMSLTLAVTKDYDTSELPPYLLACAKLFMPFLLSQVSPENAQEISDKLDKNFGNFTMTPYLCVATLDELAACENVIDKARWGSHDTAEGAMKIIDVADTDLRVVITAQHAAIRPYITSTLVRPSDGKILMRLDTPREFTARGVYLFPLNGQSTVLLVV